MNNPRYQHRDSKGSVEWTIPENAQEITDNPAVSVKQGPKHARIKQRKVPLPLLIVLIVVLSLALIACGTAFALNAIGSNNLHNIEKETITAEQAMGRNKLIEYNGKTYEYNDDIISICIMGYDKRNMNDGDVFQGQADAVMLFTMDTETGKSKVLAIPRDTMVEHDAYMSGISQGFKVEDQICLVFAYGANPENGSELVVESVSKLLNNVPIKYYYTLNINGIVPLADAIGGVTLVPVMNVDTKNTHIVEGEEITLQGEDAYYYVQYRDIKDDSSALKRQERQISFINALSKQLLSSIKQSPLTVVNVFNALTEYSTTNIGISELTYLANILSSHHISNLEYLTLTGDYVRNDEGDIAYMELWADPDSTFETVLDVFYKEVK